MKMLTLVCRENLEDYIRLLFTDLEIKGCTVITGAVAAAEQVPSPEDMNGQTATRSTW